MNQKEVEQRVQEPYVYDDAHVAEARAVVDAWDKGDIIRCVELGGIGPGYEQAIVIAVIEFTRALAEHKPTTWTGAVNVTDRVMRDRLAGCGYSGAQVGMARAFALSAVVCGWENLVSAYGDNRFNLASKKFPVAPDAPQTPKQEAA